MPDNKINLEIGIDDAQRSLQTLKSEAASLRAELQQIGNTLGTAPSSQGAAQLFQTAQRLSTIESVIQSSATVGVAAAAEAGAASFGRGIVNRSVGDPQGILNTPTGAGISGPALSGAMLYLANGSVPMFSGAFDPNAYVQSVLAAQSGPYSLIGQNLSTAQLASSQAALGGYAGFAQRYGRWEDQQNVVAFMGRTMQPGGVAPSGPSSPFYSPGDFNNYGSYLLATGQFTPQQITQGRQAIGLAAVYGSTQLLGAYTSAVTSGQPQPMAFGAAYGAMGGSLIGAVVGGALFGNPLVGAFAGGAIGSAGMNAIQAPYAARMQAAMTIGPYAQQRGWDAGALASGLADRAGDINASFGRDPQGIFDLRTRFENTLRHFGLYQGTDQTSAQDLSRVQAILGGGYLNSGVNMGAETLGRIADRFASHYGLLAPQIAEQYAHALSVVPSTGGNLVDMARSAGLPPVLTMLREDRPSYNPAMLVQQFGLMQAGERRTGMLQSRAAIGEAGYAISGFSGRPVSERGPEFESYLTGLQGVAGSLQGELNVLERTPEGASSAVAATKRALLAQAQREIAESLNQRARGAVSDTLTAGQTRLAGAGVRMTGAALYGGTGDIEGAALNTLSQLDIEAGELQHEITNPNLDFQTRQGMKQRLFAIQRDRMLIPVQARDTLLNRISGTAAVGQAQAGVGYQVALGLGTGAQVRGAANASIMALSGEWAALQDQVQQGGMTFDQAQRVNLRMSQISSEMFAVQQQGIDAAYRKEDLAGYGLTSLRLSGERERANLLPFSPSNRFALDLRTMQANQQQLDVLTRRESELRSSGQLSPERQYELEQTRQGLLTQNAGMLADLTEDLPNRLPAYSAGRPNFFASLNSNTLGALRFAELGLPTRFAGAVNGGQMRLQESFVRDLYSGDVGPRSRTQAMNADPSVVDLLARILSAIERGGESGKGAFPRRNEEVGSMHAHLSRHDLGEGDLYRNSGN